MASTILVRQGTARILYSSVPIIISLRRCLSPEERPVILSATECSLARVESQPLRLLLRKVSYMYAALSSFTDSKPGLCLAFAFAFAFALALAFPLLLLFAFPYSLVPVPYSLFPIP